MTDEPAPRPWPGNVLPLFGALLAILPATLAALSPRRWLRRRRSRRGETEASEESEAEGAPSRVRALPRGHRALPRDVAEGASR